MSYNGTIVGSPTFGPAKFSNGLLGTSDSDYISLPTGVLPAFPYTLECWLKTTATSVQVALSSSVDPEWFGINTSGHFTVTNDGGGQVDSGIPINDGNWHHCAAVWQSTGIQTFVDGAVGATSVATIAYPSVTTLFIGRFEATTFAWSGGIDEVAIWNFVKYTGAYTVPTAPYTGTESGLQALYHLQNNAVDSAGSSSGLVIDPTNAAIIYSPYNWNVVTGQASSINSGAYLRTIFSGSSIAVETNTSPNASPFSQFWARIDNQGWQLFTIAAGNPTIVVATGLDTSKDHMFELVVKSTSETLTRWASSQTVLQITGLLIDTGASVMAPIRRTKNVLIYGDSITEGFRVYGTGSPDTSNSDALGCYSYALVTALDAEVGVVGFGGQGVTVGGVGGVPALPSSYNLIYSGVSRSFTSPSPDLVIYNEGTNDSGSITAGLTTVVNAIIAAAPSSKHLLLVPFNGTHASEIAAVVSGIGSANVTDVSTTGWFNTADSADGVHPYNYSSVDLIAPKLYPQVMTVLYPSSGGGGSVGTSYAAS